MLRSMAELQGALKNLDVARGIPPILLSRSAEWIAAIRGVAALARSERPRVPKAATAQQVLLAITQENSLNTRRLLALTWLACGRTGDIRQLAAADVGVTIMPDESSATITLTFRAGKTVARRGPFSLHTRLQCEWLAPLHFASWAALADTNNWVPSLKQSTTQDVLRALRRVDGDLENRSLRRGALQRLASCGVPEELLLEFSGHTSVSTLRRYLAWGAIGTHKRQAMVSAAVALGGSPFPSHSLRAPQRWLQFLGAESPPTDALPTRTLRRAPHTLMPLSSKPVAGTVNYAKAAAEAKPPLLRRLCTNIFRYLHDEDVYEQLRRSAPPSRIGPSLNSVPIRKFATSSLSQEEHEMQIMLRKYERREQGPPPEIAAWVRIFSIPQWAKKPPVRRHIAEPACNDWFAETPTIHFTSRAARFERLQKFAGSFGWTCDLASFFDQFCLDPKVRKYFGVRRGASVTRLRVMPMGFRPSAQIAQAFTWALLDCLGVDPSDERATIMSYIDNILIVARTAAEVVRLREKLLARARELGAVFNPEGLDAEPSHCFEFLGDKFDLGETTDATVCRSLSSKTKSKLSLIDPDWLWPMTEAPPPITKRQLAAVVGLLLFADGSGTPGNQIWRAAAALRYFRDQTQGWDDIVTPPSLASQASFRHWLTRVRKDTAVPLAPRNAPQHSDVLMVDASSLGWAALHIDHLGHAHVHHEPWSEADRAQHNVESSVISEPLAILRAVCRCISATTSSGVLVLTDHQPLQYAVVGDCAKTYAYWKVQRLVRTFPVPITIRAIPGTANSADRFSRQFPASSLEGWEFCNAVSLSAFEATRLQMEHQQQQAHGSTGEPEWLPTARNPMRTLLSRELS
jgi:hypothetical protein